MRARGARAAAVVLAVVPLSLLAALLFALAATLQQHAARAAATAPGRVAAVDARAPVGASSWLPVLPLLHRIVRDRIWLLGWVTNLVGFLAQAAALHLGSIAVVQPLLVAQLLFALPLSSLSARTGGLGRRRLGARDWAGATAICGGLVVLLTVRGAAPQSTDPQRTRVLLATAAAAVLIVALVSVGRRLHHQPQLRAALIAVAAGLCFSLTAMFITLTAADLIHRGVGATAMDWPGYALAGSTLLGLLLEQDAFAAGSLPTAVAAMTITNPVASYLAGILAFDGTAPGSAGALAGVSSAGLLIIVGVLLLAQSPAVHDESELPTRNRGVFRPAPES